MKLDGIWKHVAKDKTTAWGNGSNTNTKDIFYSYILIKISNFEHKYNHLLGTSILDILTVPVYKVVTTELII